MKNKLIVLLLLASSLFGQYTYNFNWDGRQGSLISKFGTVGTNSGALFNQSDKGFALNYDGSNDKTTFTTTQAIKSVAIWCNPRLQTNQDILDLNGTQYVSISSAGTITANGFTSPTIYVNNSVSSTVVSNKWQMIVITTGTSFNSSTIQLAYKTNYYRGQIARVITSSSVWSTAEQNRIYQEFVTSSYSPRSIYPTPTMDDILTNKDVYIDERFDYGASGIAGRIPGWIAGTGSYKISEATSDDAVVKSIKKGTKYLQCMSAGVISLPSVASYATLWEFDLYKGDNANTTDLYFGLLENNPVAGSRGNGYQIRLGADETISLIRRINGSGGDLAKTVSSYISNSTWYHITINRKIGVDSFYVYIQGGAYTNKTKVSVVGGSGANPVYDATYKTSKFFVLDLDAGDRFANLKITNANYLTKGYYDYSDRSSMTLTPANKVTQWNDKSGQGNHLLQADTSKAPQLQADDNLFDGVDNYIKRAFTLNQPTSVYAVLKQVTWTNNERIWDGNVGATMILNQRGTTPYLGVYSGAYATETYSRLALNTFGILRVVYNSTSSSIQLNNKDKVVGNAGTSNAGGFTLGSIAEGTSAWSNIKVKSVILIQGLLDPMRDEILRNGLKYKYGIVY